MEMGRLSQICDYFVIASAASARQVKAIADNIERETDRRGCRTYHTEGYNEGTWVLLDYHDVIAHIFMQDAREFYDLERLWADAPKERFREPRIGHAKENAGYRESYNHSS